LWYIVRFRFSLKSSSRAGKAIRLSEDHTAHNAVESQRIQDSGGFIINGRVNGHIVITRSLGDHLMKEFIINTPHLYSTTLTDEDTHLILACDGLWDVVLDQEAVNFVLENDNYTATDLAKRLVVKALEAGSTDNLSVIVVKL
jgi:protein phosphatase PTC1